MSIDGFLWKKLLWEITDQGSEFYFFRNESNKDSPWDICLTSVVILDISKIHARSVSLTTKKGILPFFILFMFIVLPFPYLSPYPLILGKKSIVVDLEVDVE